MEPYFMGAGTIRRTCTRSNERSSSAHLLGYPSIFSKDTSLIFGDLFLSYCSKFHIPAHSVTGPACFFRSVSGVIPALCEATLESANGPQIARRETDIDGRHTTVPCCFFLPLSQMNKQLRGIFPVCFFLAWRLLALLYCQIAPQKHAGFEPSPVQCCKQLRPSVHLVRGGLDGHTEDLVLNEA